MAVNTLAVSDENEYNHMEAWKTGDVVTVQCGIATITLPFQAFVRFAQLVDEASDQIEQELDDEVIEAIKETVEKPVEDNS